MTEYKQGEMLLLYEAWKSILYSSYMFSLNEPSVYTLIHSVITLCLIVTLEICIELLIIASNIIDKYVY